MITTPPETAASSQPLFPYHNRELSWMDFNIRILEEAMRRENPVLERVKFLSITASNLDEFFMVRVAGLHEQVNSRYKEPDAAGLTPQQQLAQLSEKIHAFSERQYACWNRSLLPALKKEAIEFLSPNALNPEQQALVDHYFDKFLFPVLTPLAVDRSRPFPLLANKSLNIAVRLINQEGESQFAFVQVPAILPRFVELPAAQGRAFLLLEQIIMMKMPLLFELHQIEAMCPFRVTRNSDLAIDEDAEDLLEEIQKSIKERKRGRPVRLEINHRCDAETKEFLIEMLEVGKKDIYSIPGPIDLTFCMKLSGLEGYDALRYEPIVPMPAADFWECEDMFAAIREKDRLVHHPYESFDCVVRFAAQAAADPNVLAIKQTLYRVSGNSPIIAALIRAAENGKQVTVLVELKARFDEENNIHWAKKLEEAGCHVIYGLAGLKTHCKILLVVRQEEDGIRRYVHMGTGNYNDSTARLYTDIGMFTCRETFGSDASSLFNVLTGYSRPPEYRKMIVAPDGMRATFRMLIQKEIENAERGLPNGITIKVNSLVDPEMIQLLYRASQSGVPVRLVVRGICCLIPGLPGVSENIVVHSIVGQLLEHSRIFRFENGGSPTVYLGSADWMQRNLDRRVELIFPVEDADLKKRVLEILNTMLSDNDNARVQLSDTSYVPVSKRGKKAVNCQRVFYAMARERIRTLEAAEKENSYTPLKNPRGSDRLR